ncbi:MAG: ShlB/FhaC/HecB family hemolysin secretion/activation protein [Inquilinus sp.]|nr:ShlB/FhaC/HecB family hemolysin secretion/activation protein [Inquilinus sp.]
MAIAVSAIAAAILAAGGSIAQVPPPAELQPGISPDRVPPLAEPLPQPDVEVPAQPSPAVPPGAEGAVFLLAGLEVDGSTVYEPGVFRQYYEEYLQTEISLATLYGIATAIETRYREDGYILSRVIVPAQSVSDGIYRLQAIEGYVTQVLLEGEVGSVRGLVQSYLDKITRNRPVNIRDIERYLLLMNDLPGIRGNGVLRPAGAEIGAAELIVTATRDAFDGFVLADNRGSEFTGEQGVALGAATSSFTSFGERAELVLFSALDDKEQRVGQITYEQQIGSEGLTISGLASYGTSEPGGTLAPLDIEQETTLFSISASYPYVRTRRFNFGVEAGFDYVDQTSDLAGSPLFDDSLRVLWATAEADYRDSFGGANFGSIGVRAGLPILGASEDTDNNRSRVDGNADFVSLNAEAARLQRLTSNLNLLVSLGGQYGFGELLSSEEFEVGGLSFGRGYDPSELTGDSGAGSTVELQFNNRPGLSWLDSYQVYAFWDFGVVWNYDPLADKQDTLSSAGLGIRSNLTDWLSLDLEVAQPLTRELENRTEDRDSERYFFRVTGQF